MNGRGAPLDERERAKREQDKAKREQDKARALTGTAAERRAYLADMFTAQDVRDIIRHGGTSRTGMAFTVVDLDGGEHSVHLETERDATIAALRAELIAQANVMAAGVTSGNAAMTAFFLLCSLATVVNPVRPLDQLRERVDAYREDAERTEGLDLGEYKYRFLAGLKAWPYGKRELDLWRARREHLDPGERQPPKPRPPLFVVENEDGTVDEWTSVGHLGTYVRHHNDDGMTISAEQLGSGVSSLGGQRRRVQAWDAPGQARVHKLTLVLLRLPRLVDDADYPAAGTDLA